ncbi:phosphatidylserine/phosphatidylglycerophosphate/cardiolipin synthase-like enzyme [Rhodoblastus acidophilus]|uniref:phospholipase D-like domain-containing protein n=1 Tax=Rhodoblastus acidophilus TaxID=1074 RepID=UPI0022254619|nr:phospholipase D-like domain-containing protein [Rhodoblastus acidophilus]MCW2315761.1 phosphatidylserine/phosphatidylglycerophosphate/cardiolipin synthase-like enzyme [Rhodoblastus acidophilus]
MRGKTILIAGALLVALAAPKTFLQPTSPVTAPVRVAYGPSDGFEAIDPDLINRAKDRIDMAAYVLSDQKIIEALSEAASRGVKIRIYLDPEQFRRIASGNENMLALVNQPNVSARIKAEQNDMMHLKTFAVDGRWLRTGSANFSWSGERRQDNDIVVIDSPELAQDFSRHFDRIWARRDNREAAR